MNCDQVDIQAGFNKAYVTYYRRYPNHIDSICDLPNKLKLMMKRIFRLICELLVVSTSNLTCTKILTANSLRAGLYINMDGQPLFARI